MITRRYSWKVLAVLAGTAALAGAQPDQDGRKGDPERPGGRPRGEQGRPERPGAEHRDRGAAGRAERRGAERFLRAYDRDDDKAVTFAEFRAGAKIRNMSDGGKKRIFDHLDKNGDGKIVRSELPRGGGPEGGGARFGDKNRDGKISIDEFRDSDRWKNASPEARKEIFKRMDLNGDGFLTPEDFRQRPEGSWPWDRRRPLFDPKAMATLDLDQDGALSFEEWKKSPRFKETPPERLREWFDRMDRNDDGVLDEADRPGGPPRRGPEGRPPGPAGKGPEGRPRRGGGTGRHPGAGSENP